VNQTKGSIVILTGAGISAESGIQTFRGADGLFDLTKNHVYSVIPTTDAWLTFKARSENFVIYKHQATIIYSLATFFILRFMIKEVENNVQQY
jgi:NAD-dependent SIR2 family protein deacetylase